jgi:hypothetical protein
MEIVMNPASSPHSRDTNPINGGWTVFGTLLAEGVRPKAPPVSQHPEEEWALRLTKRLQRLLAWWTRPLPVAASTNATDAATRLEILTRGGFPR